MCEACKLPGGGRAGRKSGSIQPQSFLEEVNFDRKRMELGRVPTTGQGQLIGCPSPTQGCGRAIGRETAAPEVRRLPKTAPSHSKVTSPTTSIVSKSGRKEGLAEKSHEMKPVESRHVWESPEWVPRCFPAPAVGCGVPALPWPDT